MSEIGKTDKAPDANAEDLVAQVETGARQPAGISAKFLTSVLIAWSLFQIWIASPLPFMFDFFVLNSNQSRSVHLAFAIFLTFTLYPALKHSPRDRVPWYDWILAIVAAFCGGYLFLFNEALADRPGNPIMLDLVAGSVGLIVLLEATRRALGPPLTIVALVFLAYVFFGHLAPDVIAWKGASINKGLSHMWLGTEGVFGKALEVSTTTVFLFVLFGALLEKAGAGNYFISVAFALLGHLRGGPAKAAVVSSGLTGLISGSSIANTVTTGTFTIPLMKRVGFKAEKAAAVEVAASTNGQLTPPIMGAAAFLMVEFVGISYIEVIKHALLPAVISYIALIYIVHLEAVKADLQGLPRRRQPTMRDRVISFGLTLSTIIILAAAVYYGLGWMKDAFGGATATVIGAVIVLIVYLALLWASTRYPPLKPSAELTELPDALPTAMAGLYFVLPLIVLIWCLVVERFSPGLSAFWGTVFLLIILITQRPLIALFRHSGDDRNPVVIGFVDLLDGLVAGARNMIGIGVATATAGIIVGTVTLTGIGLVMTEFVEAISGGNLFLVLFFTAVICLILGMGLPTTANYIVVSSLMAGVVVELGSQAGLAVPLIAVHMFVFYFGILADDTPPVGLAAFAGAAIARSDPIKTGVQGFAYDIRTAILPFLFIFNTQLLLIGIESVIELIGVVVTAVIAMLLFAAATQGYFLVRSRIWETAVLLLIAFTLFRPGFWWDMIYPPYRSIPPADLVQMVGELPDDAQLRMRVSGSDMQGNPVDKVVILPMGPRIAADQRLQAVGLMLRTEPDGRLIVENVGFESPAEKLGISFDYLIKAVELPTERPPKELMWLPALLLLGGVVMLQLGRRRRQLAAV